MTRDAIDADCEWLLTLEEYERLPDDGAYRDELSRGRLVREPQPGAPHGRLVAKVFRVLDRYARESGAGEAVIEAGFLLAADPPIVRGPDVAFITAERLPPGGPPSGWWSFAPDLAVEVVSPSNTATEMHNKVLEYLDAGTRLVWVINPETRTVTAWRSREEVGVLEGEELLEAQDVLPGLDVRVAEIFAA